MNAQSHMVSGFAPMPADMVTQRQQAPLNLAPVGAKAVALDCAGGRLSSDAGVVLLKDIDAQLGLTRHLAAVLSDPRDPRRIHFTLEDLSKPRVVQIAAGYADANDSNTLRDAPIFTLLLDRLPETGASLVSHPTLSRFENRVSRPELYRMALEWLHHFIASYASAPKVIVLDVNEPGIRLLGASSKTPKCPLWSNFQVGE
jgi:Transposase DDE domain group 1